ncbi:GNAT family N-acetyltransferase [Candidatus Saccharibacteria bacterium]|nr:GNAT family N-acetyltransferase [Candidatus Saccharibacteria bacterium]
MKDVIIRKATIEDFKTVQQFGYDLLEYERKNWDKELDPSWPFSEEGAVKYKQAIEEKITLIAEKDERPVGFLIGKILPSNPKDARHLTTAYLENIYVTPDVRGKSVSKGLIEGFMDYCKKEKVDRIDVMVNAKNAAAIKFYEKSGYSTATLRMSKQLK